MERGTVVLAVLPFTDLSGRKQRPGVVVSPENRAGQDLLIAFITSYKGEPLLPTDLLISKDDPDFKETGLKLTSVVRLDKLFTLQKGLIIGKLGNLSARLIQKIDEGLRLALGL